MADLGIIFLRRRYPIHWYQSSCIFITGSMPFRYFWATLYSQPCLSRICWDWRNSFDLETNSTLIWGLTPIECKDKRTWIGFRLRRLFDLCKVEIGQVDCMYLFFFIHLQYILYVCYLFLQENTQLRSTNAGYLREIGRLKQDLSVRSPRK